mgnify:CR=1 FL=1|jgi:hypothetical protein
MEAGQNYMLQLLMETTGEVRNPGEQLWHESQYYPTLNDAFEALLKVRCEQFDLTLTNRFAEHGLRYVKEAAIKESYPYERVILQVDRDAADVPEGILRPVHLCFPETIRNFEQRAGLFLQACENYDPSSKYLLFTFHDAALNEYTHNKGLSSIVKSVNGNRPDPLTWNYTLQIEGKTNPDLLTDHAKEQGWQFCDSWHYKELSEAVGHLLNLELNSRDSYVAFHKFLDIHISAAYVNARDGSPLISLLRQSDMVHHTLAPKQRGLYLFFHDDPVVLPKELGLDFANVHAVGNDAYVHIARYNDSLSALEPLENYENLRAKFPEPSMSGAGSKQMHGFELVVERESLAGEDHLSGFNTLKRYFPTIQQAIRRLAELAPTYFSRAQAIKEGHLIKINTATIVDQSSGKPIIERMSNSDNDIFKVDMSMITTEVLRAIRPYWEPLERMTSPHYWVGRLRSTQQAVNTRQAIKKPKTIMENTNCISLKR